MKKAKIMAILMVLSLLTTTMIVPVSAESSFEPTSANFVTLFDFDTIPGTYKDGYEPGKRNDTVGDSKSEKCITGEGLGLTYTLTIKSGAGIKNNALKLDVKNAPEAGTWCPVSLNVKFGQKKFAGAPSKPSDFVFWVDTTGYKDNTNDQNIEKGINMYVQETDVDKNGSFTDKATAWKVKCKEDGGYIYYEDGKGGWSKKETSPKKQGDFYLPKNYKGWIKIPIENFVHTDWNVDDTDGEFNGKQIQAINLGMGNYKIQNGSTVIFDEFGFIGKFENTSKTAKITEADETIKQKTTTSGTNEEDVVTDKKSSPWKVIVPIIIIAAIGVGGYFLYKKFKK